MAVRAYVDAGLHGAYGSRLAAHTPRAPINAMRPLMLSSLAVQQGMLAILLALGLLAATPFGGSATTAACIVGTLVASAVQVRREARYGAPINAISLFVAVHVFLWVAKPFYVLYVSQSIHQTSLAEMSQFEGLVPYMHRAMGVAAIGFAGALLSYNMSRMGRSVHHGRPQVSVRAARVQAAKISAVVIAVVFAAWIAKNGGPRFITWMLGSLSDIRSGRVAMPDAALRPLFVPALFPLLLLVAHYASRGAYRLRGAAIIGLGMALSYMQAASVSATVLFVFTAFLVHDLATDRHRADRTKAYVRLGVAVVLLAQAATMLKFMFVASASSRSFGSTFSGLASAYYGDASMWLDFFFGKFNSIEVVAVEIRAFADGLGFYGPAYHVSGLLSFFPTGTIGLSGLETGSLGTRWAADVGSGISGGYNLTLPGSLYAIYGLPAVVVGSIAIGILFAAADRLYLKHRASGTAIALYAAFLSYFVLFFTRTGGPTISFRRVVWLFFAYLAVLIASRVLVRVARRAATRTPRP